MDLRTTLGKLKYHILDDWPFVFAEKRAHVRREQLRSGIATLPPLVPDASVPIDLEAHILCSKRDLDMGIISSWSLLRFFRNPVLWVHSDGTLDAGDIALWRRATPALEFVEKAVADARAKEALAESFPLLYAWRSRKWWGLQTIDVHLFGARERFLVFDSDVLCFSDPRTLKEALAADPSFFTWNRDTHDCYSARPALLREVLGETMPEAFNIGFSVEPRQQRAAFARLEMDLEKIQADGRIDPDHFWSGQTYPALWAARTPGSKPLPAEYAVVRGRTTERTVVRHYVSNRSIRPRYFLEGVPRILGSLEEGRG